MRRTSTSVLDASALLQSLLRGPGARAVEELMQGQAAHAPEVMDAELLHALRRKLGRGELSEAHADRLVTLIQRAPIERVSHEPLVRIAWRLRNNVSAYDALYVALAQRLSAPLVTADARLARAPGLGVPVTLVPSR